MLVLLAAGGFSATRVAPIYFRFYSYEDEFRQSARFASQQTDSIIKLRLGFIADSLGLPAAARDVHVDRAADSVRVYATYSELIDLVVWKRVMRFNPRAAAAQ